MVNYTVFLILALFFICSTSGKNVSENLNALGQELFDRLLDKYDKRVPPEGIGDDKNQVLIRITMHVLDISKMDHCHGLFQVQYFFRQNWTDNRLRFDDKDTKVEFIVITEPEKIWKPNPFFPQEYDGKVHDVLILNKFTRLHRDGTIGHSMRVSSTFTCRMDLRSFPFDTHKCPITLDSYGLNHDRIHFIWDNTKSWVPLSHNDDIYVPEFTLRSLTPSEVTEISHGMLYKNLHMTFIFDRRTSFFTLRLFIPFIILIILSWLPFWISPQYFSLRLTLLLTVFCLMVHIGYQIISCYVPPTTYTKGSDVWIGICETLVFGAILEFVYVSLLFRQETAKGTAKFMDETNSGIEVEAKKGDAAQYDGMSFSDKLVAKALCRDRELSKRIDFISKVLFPVTFVLFNIVYWSVYTSSE